MTPPDDKLNRHADAFLGHLDLEAAALLEAGDALEQMHRALRTSALAQLEDARARRLALSARLDELRAARARLVAAAADALGVPAAGFTLRALGARVSPERGRRLDAARERTRALALAVEAVNARIAALARHGLAYVRERLEALAPADPAPRYGPAGKTVEPPRCSFLEVQG